MITTETTIDQAADHLGYWAHQLEATQLRCWTEDPDFADGGVQGTIYRVTGDHRPGAEPSPLLRRIVAELAVGVTDGQCNPFSAAPLVETDGGRPVPGVSPERSALRWVYQIEHGVIVVGGGDHGYRSRALDPMAQDELRRLSCTRGIERILVTPEVFALAHATLLPYSTLRKIVIGWPVESLS